MHYGPSNRGTNGRTVGRTKPHRDAGTHLKSHLKLILRLGVGHIGRNRGHQWKVITFPHIEMETSHAMAIGLVICKILFYLSRNVD